MESRKKLDVERHMFTVLISYPFALHLAVLFKLRLEKKPAKVPRGNLKAADK